MNFASQKFTLDLQEALRHGMTDALRHFKSLQQVDVKGVERTLYPIIRETATAYLKSIGYFYLTQHPNFFVIGETSIAGTQKRADGFICDPFQGAPLYAIEVGIGNHEKFWSDYQKSIKEWSRTGILGTFILLFVDREKADNTLLYKLDSASLRTPFNEDFHIFSLVLPLDPNFQNALLSLTAFQYFERHHGITFRMMTISGRNFDETKKWTTNLIAPLLEEQQRFLINHIYLSYKISKEQLVNALEQDTPELLVIEGGRCPFSNFDDEMRAIFLNYLEKHQPILVIIGERLKSEDWEKDPSMAKLLPIEFIGRNYADGKWEYWNGGLKFGQDILPATEGNWLNLTNINNSNYVIRGFVKSQLKAGRSLSVDMFVKLEEETFPLIVSDATQKIVWLGSGVGGWGSNWYSKYPEGFQEFWKQVLLKIQSEE